jgi:hypothetical protein
MLNERAENRGWCRSKSWGHFTAVAMKGNLEGCCMVFGVETDIIFHAVFLFIEVTECAMGSH